jgi:hypothetical protein
MGVCGIEFAGEEVTDALSLEESDKQSASEISILLKLIFVLRNCRFDEKCGWLGGLYLLAAASFNPLCIMRSLSERRV